MTDVLASVDKSMCLSIPSRDLATISSDYPTENIFYTDGSMRDDVAGFAVHNRNYETEHQLAKPSSVFSAEISAIRMALEHIQICSRGRYLILSDSLSSLMAMRSRRIRCKTHPWVYESKQIYWDLQQLNYDVKLIWISSHVDKIFPQ
jgi:ribonuclease HI